MNHDQLFKELIQAFFAEFLTLFFPVEAAQLDLDSVTFLNNEAFTDVPDGALRRADLVAEVQTRTGEMEILLFHFEVQGKRESDIPFRMWEYYALLRLRRRRPVVPIVLYLAPGTGGMTRERYTETVFGRTFLTFEYIAIGLPDMTATEYENTANPLAAALSVLMRSTDSDRVGRKLRALTRVAGSALDEARKLILATVVDRYLPLNPADTAAFTERLQRDTQQGVTGVMSIYDLIREDGLQQGVQQGILAGQRATLLRQLRLKFGELTPTIVEQIQALDSANSLELLADRILTANSLEEMHFEEITGT